MEEAKQTLQALLEKIAKEQEYVEHTVNVEEFSGGGSHMTSALYGVTLRAEGKSDLRFFSKVSLMSDQARKASPTNDQFATELYFYNKLQKEYQRIEEKYGIPEEHKVRTPKLYGSHEEFLKETLVLEDLITKGYKNFDTSKTADLEYVTAAIDLLAKFHALSLAFHHDDPESFRQASASLTIDLTTIKTIVPIMTPNVLANALELANGEHREKLERYLTQEPSPFDQIPDWFRSDNNNIIVHGDFKPSNLMHKRRDGKLEIVPVDFQTVADGHPIRDLVYFLVTATDEAFRREHYHAMLDLYHERLREALDRFQIDIEDVYSENTYRAQLKKHSMSGLLVALILLPMVLAEEEKLPDLGEEFEVTDIFVDAGKIYKEHLNGLINNYVEWGLL